MNITAGKYKGRKITAPDEKITRPTLSKTRMGVFNSLYSILEDFEGKSFDRQLYQCQNFSAGEDRRSWQKG